MDSDTQGLESVLDSEYAADAITDLAGFTLEEVESKHQSSEVIVSGCFSCGTCLGCFCFGCFCESCFTCTW
jgi:hypothetical protein